MIVKKIVKPARDSADFASGIVRLHNSWIDASKRNRDKFHRREAVLITNPDNGQSIVRMAMGSNATPGLSRNAAALDYDAVDALGVGYNVYEGTPLHLLVKRATPLDVFRHFWNHPDIGYRTAHQIAVVSLAMGLIGLGLGMVALF